MQQSGDNRIVADVKPRVVDELLEKSNTWKLVEINEPSQCSSLRLPDNLLTVKVRIAFVLVSSYYIVGRMQLLLFM